MIKLFKKIIDAQAGPEAGKWLRQAIADLQPLMLDRLLRYFAEVPRYIQPVPVVATAQTQELAQKTAINPEKWQLDELARIALLIAIAEIPSLEYRQLIAQCYNYGDNRERIAIIKGLSLLAHRQEHLAIALDAHRSNIVPIFAALAIANPFPAEMFDDHHFNNLVLKSLFVQLPILQIHRIQERKSRDLARMIEEWIDEREAASRPFPPEVWILVCPFADGDGLKRAYRYLQGEDAEHRRQVAIGLSAGNDR